MKIRALWGFEGDASKLKADTSRVRAGQTFDDVDAEYGHTLVGKGLVEEVRATAPAPAPKTTKPAAPKETK